MSWPHTSGALSRLLLGLLALAVLPALLAACEDQTDFPDPTNPVVQIPWPEYELLRYDIADQTDALLGTLELEAERQGDEWRFRLLFQLEDGNVHDETFVWVDAETLQPHRYERLATSADERVEVRGTYEEAPNGSILHSVVIENGERSEEELTIGEFAFDNDSSAWLWRSLDFRQDLEQTYRSVNVFFQRTQLVRLRVAGQDQLQTPEGNFVVWRVTATPGVELNTTWYQVDPPHRLVRWDQQPRRFLLREIVTERPDA